MTVRIKICGITRVNDAITAASLGVDAIGLVFFSGSKRCVNLTQAKEIVRHLPPFVSVVGLFVNAHQQEIEHILQHVPLDILQFHGDETHAFCAAFNRPFIKAIRVAHANDIERAILTYPDARALLFDTYVAGQFGGTGQTFDWQIIPQNIPVPWILAGGLTVNNISDAIQQSQAQAVDVSGGVEIDAGIKDYHKMKMFIQRANGVDI